MSDVVTEMDAGVLREIHISMIDLWHRGYELPIRWTIASFANPAAVVSGKTAENTDSARIATTTSDGIELSPSFPLPACLRGDGRPRLVGHGPRCPGPRRRGASGPSIASPRRAGAILRGMRIREPWPSARTRQRRREFAAVFEGVPSGGLGDGLEIGGGDGFLASLVAAHCRSFVTTDSYRPRLADCSAALAGGVRRLVCDAARLPFADASFDFIFSSSVLEHIRDRAPVYRELRRCLRPGGVMLHIMPSRTWKALQLLFYYPHHIIGGIDLALDALTRTVKRRAPAAPASAQALCTNRWSDERRLTLKIILENVLPQPHGEYPGNLAELRGFGVCAWEREFAAAGLRAHRIVLLPLYSGYGFGFDRLRVLGERWGLSSHNAFVLTPEGAPSPALG